MMNLSQLQNNIDALIHTVATQRERITYLEKKRKQTPLVVTLSVTFSAFVTALVFLFAPNPELDCSAEKQRTLNTMNVLTQVSDERDMYVQSTEWLLGHCAYTQ